MSSASNNTQTLNTLFAHCRMCFCFWHSELRAAILVYQTGFTCEYPMPTACYSVLCDCASSFCSYFLWGYLKSIVYNNRRRTPSHLMNIRLAIADVPVDMLDSFLRNFWDWLTLWTENKELHLLDFILLKLHKHRIFKKMRCSAPPCIINTPDFKLPNCKIPYSVVTSRKYIILRFLLKQFYNLVTCPTLFWKYSGG